MENIEARKLINRIQKDLIKSGIEPEKLIKNLKKLRQFALEEQNPTITKVLRLTYEHIEAYETFAIPMPSDEPIEEIDGEPAEGQTFEDSTSDPANSLNYLLSIMDKSGNKGNLIEIREYRDNLIDYADTH